MARIPVYDRAPNISAAPSSYQQIGGRANLEGLKQIDEGIQTAVQAVGAIENLQAVREKEEAENYAFVKMQQRYDDYEFAKSEFQKEAEQDPENGAKGYTDKVANFWKDSTEEDMRKAPSDLARGYYERKMSKIQTDTLADSLKWENETNAKLYHTNTQKAANDWSKSIIKVGERPPWQEALKRYDKFSVELEERMKNGVSSRAYTAQQAKEYTFQFNNQLARGIFDKYEANEQYADGLKALSSDSKLVKDMDAELLNSYVKKFKNGSEGKATRDLSLLNAEADQFTNSAVNEGTIDPVKAKELMVRAESYRPKDKLEKFQIDNIKSQIRTTVIVGEDIKVASQEPESKWGNLPSSNMKNGLKTAEISRIENESKKALARISAQRKSDPGQAVDDAFPSLQLLRSQINTEDPRTMEAYQKEKRNKQLYLGIAPDQVRVTNKSEAAGIAAYFKKAEADPNPEALKFAIDQQINLYGKQSGKMLEELAKDGVVDKEYTVLGYVNTAASRQSIVENIKTQKDFLPRAKEKVPIKDLTDLTQKVIQEDQALFDSSVGTGQRFKLGNTIAKQVVLEAAKEIAGMEKPTPNSIKEAVVRAKKKIIDDNYYKVSGGNSRLILPKSVPNIEKETFDNFLKQSATLDGLKHFKPVPSNVNMATYDQKAEQVYLSELSREARWTASPDGKQIALVRSTPDGYRAVTTMKDGKPSPIIVEVGKIPEEYQGVLAFKENKAFGTLTTPRNK